MVWTAARDGWCVPAQDYRLRLIDWDGRHRYVHDIGDFAIPSGDGKRLAFLDHPRDQNVWILERSGQGLLNARPEPIYLRSPDRRSTYRGSGPGCPCNRHRRPTFHPTASRLSWANKRKPGCPTPPGCRRGKRSGYERPPELPGLRPGGRLAGRTGPRSVRFGSGKYAVRSRFPSRQSAAGQWMLLHCRIATTTFSVPKHKLIA